MQAEQRFDSVLLQRESGMNAGPFISTQQLSSELGGDTLSIVDASWYLPQMNRNAAQEYAEGHIPGAVYFDLDKIATQDTGLPHMLASSTHFADTVGALGISEQDLIVVYDGAGLFSAARVWWNFKVMGATNVRVLKGGFPRWKSEALDISTEKPEPMGKLFRPAPLEHAAKTAADVLGALKAKSHQVVDVRPAPRFAGEVAEPRAGLRSGAMPGAKNLPFSELVRDGALVSNAELRALFSKAGIDASQPIISTCGSGVTAPMLNLALAQLGHDHLHVYDGSWAEWGGRNDLPIVTGQS